MLEREFIAAVPKCCCVLYMFSFRWPTCELMVEFLMLDL